MHLANSWNLLCAPVVANAAALIFYPSLVLLYFPSACVESKGNFVLEHTVDLVVQHCTIGIHKCGTNSLRRPSAMTTAVWHTEEVHSQQCGCSYIKHISVREQ